MPVHNHGPAEGRGLDCPERATPAGLKGWCIAPGLWNADALGTTTAGMWHDPNGIIYPYDDEDLRIINAAKRAKLEQDRS